MIPHTLIVAQVKIVCAGIASNRCSYSVKRAGCAPRSQLVARNTFVLVVGESVELMTDSAFMRVIGGGLHAVGKERNITSHFVRDKSMIAKSTVGRGIAS